MKAIIFFCFLGVGVFAQSDLDKILKGSEVLITGLSILKNDKPEKPEGDIVESVCIKNKLPDKVTLNLSGKDAKGNTVVKTLVILSDGKECLLELPKGVYSYEIVLSNKEIFKRGEYRFDESMTITVKAP